MLLEHIVSPAEDGQTLRQLVRGAMALSGRQAREAFSKGAVSVDAAPFFSNQPVRTGMVVRVALGGYGDTLAPKDVPPVEVVFEDDALIAVFKPAPLQCHPSPSAPGGSDTLQARVTAYLGARDIRDKYLSCSFLWDLGLTDEFAAYLREVAEE